MGRQTQQKGYYYLNYQSQPQTNQFIAVLCLIFVIVEIKGQTTATSEYDFTKVEQINGVHYVRDQLNLDNIKLSFKAESIHGHSFTPFTPTQIGVYCEDTECMYESLDSILFGQTFTFEFWAFYRHSQDDSFLVTIIREADFEDILKFGFDDDDQLYLKYKSHNDGNKYRRSSSSFKMGWNHVGFSLKYDTTADETTATLFGTISGNYFIETWQSSGYLAEESNAFSKVLIGAEQMSTYIDNEWNGYIHKWIVYVGQEHDQTDFESRQTTTCSYTNFNPCFICPTTTGECIDDVLDPLILNIDLVTSDQHFLIDQSNHNLRATVGSSLDEQESTDPLYVPQQGRLMKDKTYIKVSNLPPIEKQFSYEMWVRRILGSSLSDAELFRLTPEGTLGTKTIYHYYDGASQKFRLSISDGDEANLSLSFTDEWFFIAVSIYPNRYDKSVIDQYINTSRDVDDVDDLIPFLPSDNPDAIFGYDFPGIINRIRAYNIARTTDLQRLWRSTTCTQTSLNPCSSCPLETGNCIPDCGSGWPGIAKTPDTCSDCHDFCGACTGTTQDDCSFCVYQSIPTNMIVQYSQESCICAEGYYEDSGLCQQCDTGCTTCFGPTTDDCYKCDTANNWVFFGSSTCTNDCPSQGPYYYDSTNKICSKCNAACLTCTGPDQDECQSCQPTAYTISANECSYNPDCPDYMYLDMTTLACSSCDADCIYCNGPYSSDCTECADPVNKVLLLSNGVNGDCLNSCPDGMYIDDDRICKDCHDSCDKCQDGTNIKCSECSNGYFKQPQSQTCKNYCQPGLYGDTTDNECNNCFYTCSTCTDGTPNSCGACQTGYSHQFGSCVEDCNLGFTSVNQECIACDSVCLTCSGPGAQDCLQCAAQKYQFNGECFDSCPDGYYGHINDYQCKPCSSVCTSCFGPKTDECYSCRDDLFYTLVDTSCIFYLCQEGTYRIQNPFLQCGGCDTSCSTCYGSTLYNCLSCDIPYIFYKGECKTCSQIPGYTESGDPFDPGCKELCGDGFNLGLNQCDDGNVISGDGCSQECQIEEAYYCEGGSETSPDICYDVKQPSFSISSITFDNNIILAFDEEIQIKGSIDQNSLSINIEGNQPSYNLDWEIDPFNNHGDPQISIQLLIDLKSTLLGSNQEKIIVLFLDKSVITDKYDNELQNQQASGYMKAFEYIDPQDAASAENAGSASMTTTLITLGINLGINILFGGSMQAMWTMINTIQLISLVPLMSIDWPPLLRILFEKMLSSHGEMSFIPNMFEEHLESGRTPYSDRFNDYGWHSTNFLYLSGRKIILLIFVLILYPIILRMKIVYADKHRWCRIWESVEGKYRYSGLLRIIMLSYVSFFLNAALDLKTLKLETNGDIISVAISLLTIVIMIYFPIQILNIFQKSYRQIKSKNKEFNRKWSTLLLELDTTSPLKYLYYPLFLTRRIVFALILIFFDNNPYIQIGAVILSSIVLIIYVLVFKPQVTKFSRFLSCFSEMILIIVVTSGLWFANETQTEGVRNFIAWVIFVIVCLCILINWMLVVSAALNEVCKNYKTKQEKLKLKIEEQKIREEEIEMEFLRTRREKKLKQKELMRSVNRFGFKENVKRDLKEEKKLELQQKSVLSAKTGDKEIDDWLVEAASIARQTRRKIYKDKMSSNKRSIMTNDISNETNPIVSVGILTREEDQDKLGSLQKDNRFEDKWDVPDSNDQIKEDQDVMRQTPFSKFSPKGIIDNLAPPKFHNIPEENTEFSRPASELNIPVEEENKEDNHPIFHPEGNQSLVSFPAQTLKEGDKKDSISELGGDKFRPKGRNMSLDPTQNNKSQLNKMMQNRGRVSTLTKNPNISIAPISKGTPQLRPRPRMRQSDQEQKAYSLNRSQAQSIPAQTAQNELLQRIAKFKR